MCPGKDNLQIHIQLFTLKLIRKIKNKLKSIEQYYYL